MLQPEPRLGAVREQGHPHLAHRLLRLREVFKPLQALGVLLCRCTPVALGQTLVSGGLPHQRRLQRLATFSLVCGCGELLLRDLPPMKRLRIFGLQLQASFCVGQGIVPASQAQARLRPVGEKGRLKRARLQTDQLMLHFLQASDGARICGIGVVSPPCLQRCIAIVFHLQQAFDQTVRRLDVRFALGVSPRIVRRRHRVHGISTAACEQVRRQLLQDRVSLWLPNIERQAQLCGFDCPPEVLDPVVALRHAAM
mmetsp:Transcript_106507/g.306185  ORF Transcript_106507/g.306185 Transcript_106507/m.306185 type:complete len:254 (-) Transcript_106507:392-1153(-)